jgi:hypothetical protein
MKENQTLILVLALAAAVVLYVATRKKTTTYAPGAIPPSAGVTTGTSVWSTLIKTVGDTAVGILGNKQTGTSSGGSGEYSVNYTDSSLRLGGG